MKGLLFSGLISVVLFSCNSPTAKTEATANSPAVMAVANPAGRIAETFADLKAQNIRISQLDSVYPSGINIDSTKAVFNGKTHEFIEAYRQMITDAGAYLAKNDSLRNTKFSYFNRIYFEANGTVDYYLYSKLNGLDSNQQVIFKKLLNQFIQQYKFPMTAKTPFAQCCPVIIEPR